MAGRVWHLRHLGRTDSSRIDALSRFKFLRMTSYSLTSYRFTSPHYAVLHHSRSPSNLSRLHCHTIMAHMSHQQVTHVTHVAPPCHTCSDHLVTLASSPVILFLPLGHIWNHTCLTTERRYALSYHSHLSHLSYHLVIPCSTWSPMSHRLA